MFYFKHYSRLNYVDFASVRKEFHSIFYYDFIMARKRYLNKIIVAQVGCLSAKKDLTELGGKD
jgi:hypothetical protein